MTDPVTRTQILEAVNKIVADQRTAIDAAVAAQKAADDGVINGMQTAIDLLVQQVAEQKATMDLQAHTIADQAAEIERLQDLLDGQAGTEFGALCGILKGSGETKAQARARVTALYGGVLPVERIYLERSFDPQLVNVGHSVIGTWAFSDFAGVMAGDYDAQITAYAAAWKGPGILYLGPNHEPDQEGRPYSASQFAALAARVCAAIKAAGNPLVKTTVILMSFTLTKGDAWKAFHDGYTVDVLGWDAYWRPTTQRTAEAVYGPCRDASAGRAWLIGETSMGALHNLGSMQRDSWQPIPEEEWTRFVTEGIPLLTSAGCVAATWFETNLVDGDGRLAPHPGALEVWKAAVAASHA